MSAKYNLDRKDNSIGYSKNNCVVCCSTCNYIKGDKFTYELRTGTSVDLRTLYQNQLICASGIKGHHILMTEIQDLKSDNCNGLQKLLLG